jgi:hypothetical protein
VDWLARGGSICEVSAFDEDPRAGCRQWSGWALSEPDDVIELRHVSKRFGEFVAVHDADFAA